MANPKALVLDIKNNTGMVGWIRDCKLHEQTPWNPDQRLRDNLPIGTRASVQGTVDFRNQPTGKEPVLMSSLIVGFERVPGTTMAGSVLVEFGVQFLSKDVVQPFLGATESTPWLVPDVNVFTDGETSIGWVTIDVFNVFPALIPGRLT